MTFLFSLGGQFGPARGGQFPQATGGHIKPEKGGQFDRRLHFNELALGIVDIETVRKAVNKKGLPVSRSQFWNLVHNMVYCGRVEIAAYKEEGAHYVKGIHQPLITEALFDEVQDILHGRKRVTKVRSTKDENLPLRSFIVCKACGRPITGSGANGNGGRYYYYHCQTAATCARSATGQMQPIKSLQIC